MRHRCLILCRSVIGLLLCLILLGVAGTAPAAAAPAGPPLPGRAPAAASLPLTAPAVQQTEHTPPAVSLFADVDTDHDFYQQISWLAEAGISTGWSGPNDTRIFGPYRSVLRDQMAAFLYRIAGSPEFTAPTTSPFADVATGHDFYKEISWLAEAGISTGWSGPNDTRLFRPYEPVLRDQMAAFLYRSVGEPEFTAPAVSPFADVDTDHDFYTEISWLAEAGISTGWSGPNDTRLFRPYEPVLRDQMAAFLYRLENLQAPTAGLTITNTGLADGIAGIDYLEVLTAEGGTEPLTWSATGLPEGLTVSGDGIISGIPTEAGSSDVTVIATDADGSEARATQSLSIPEAVPAECVGQNCAVLEEKPGTIEVPAENIVSVSHDATTQQATQVVLSGLDVAPGQVLVLAPTPDVETGVTVTVDGVTPGATGSLVVSVTQATYGDAYTSGAVHSIAGTAAVAPDQGGVAGVAPGPEQIAGAQAIEVEDGLECGAGVDADIHSMSVTPELRPTMYSQWSFGRAEAFSMGLEGDLVINISASVEGGGSCQLVGKKFYATTPPGALGPLGVVIFTFDPHLRYGFNDRADVESTVRLSCHSYYVWTRTNGEHRSSYCKPSDQKLGMTSASGLSADLTAAIDVQAALNGMIGVGGELNTGVQASYESARQPQTTLTAFAGYQLYACLGCFLQDLSLTLDIFEGTFYKQVIWQAAGPPPPANLPPNPTEPLSVTTSTLPSGTVGEPYRTTLDATGGTPPYTWSITSGTLPAGLTLSPAGVLTGTPTTAGSNQFTISATDSSRASADLGTAIHIESPTSAELQNVEEIKGNGQSTYALKTDGTVWAWGWNYFGQLGNGTTTDSSIPVQISGLTNVQSIQVNYESAAYALKTDGTVWAWGHNDVGQLGNGTTTDSSVPVQVSGLTDIHSIKVGGLSAYALKTDGTVWAWGHNRDGQLGNGTTTHSSVPVQVHGLTNIGSLQANGGTMYALRTDGTVWAWGWNHYGQLGNGTTTDSSVPVQVSGLTDVRSLEAAGLSAYAVTTGGTVWAWGSNDYGLLGNGTTTNSTVPVQVSGLTDVRSIKVGGLSAYAVTTDGTVWAWGHNDVGQLGNGTTTGSSVPVQVTGLTNVRSLEANGGTVYALTTDGTVWAWGENFRGDLGNGTVTDSTVPIQVSGLTNIKSLETDGSSTYALTTDGTVVNID